jgi:FdhD protein
MARGRTETVLITRRDATGSQRVPDELIVEEPMEIRLDDHLVTTTMRTPGHDFELAAGFCFTEGLLASAPVTSVRYCGTGPASESEFNVVSVETGGVAPEPVARVSTTTSSCGICGSASLDDLCLRLDPLPGDVQGTMPIDVLARMPERAQRGQGLFASTGAVHAAVAFGLDGEPVVTREDIGRHNAVDKVVGRLLLDGRLPAWRQDSPSGLFVSGRASFEIVQKAWAAGFVAIVAVSAPSALAVSTARAAGIILAGFARGERLNLYAPERL